MTWTHYIRTVTLGFALFSMFFGAGNVVFPLAVGIVAGENIYFALMGLFLTAVIVPFVGLYAAARLEGCHRAFFAPIGKIPGFMAAFAILGLLGPFGVIPRCIALSYSTLNMYYPMGGPLLFNLGSCLLVLLCTLRKDSIISVLGNLLTPCLIAVLSAIILFGLIAAPSGFPISTQEPLESHWLGMTEGYQTMDLLAAIFFSSFVAIWLRSQTSENTSQKDKMLWISCTRNAMIIAAVLLGGVYIGFGVLAAYYAPTLHNVPQAELLGTIASQVLGSSAGLIVCIAVCLACLTTAISLAGIYADFIRKELFFHKIGYKRSLILTVAISFCFSMLEFNGIVSFLGPILAVGYPGLIVLTLYNLWKKEPAAIPQQI